MKKNDSIRKQNIITNIRIAIGSVMAVSGIILFIALGKTTMFETSTWQFILAVALFVGGILTANSVKLSASIANFFMR